MKAVDIGLTRHAIERLRERHDKHLYAYEDWRGLEISCYRLLDEAEFSNRHINDTRFMIELQEKYGFDKTYRFKEYKNVLFVIINNTVTTVLDTDDHRTSRQHGRVKRF